ncbi:MAG: hypothetical protein OQL08_02250 [Gammaproteobacteria bacterium]|nr:hypothetical protein [Gammaproteobacteria bacterium]
MNMKKTTLALAIAASIAGFAGQAAAGTASSTYNTYATEAVLAGNVAAVSSPNMGYQPSTVAASGTDFTIYIRLDGGATWTATATSITANYISNGVTVTSVAGAIVSGDSTTLAINFSAIAQPVGTSTVINIPGVAAAVNLATSTALSTVGGVETASFALVNSNAAAPISFPTSAIDTASGTVAASAAATAVAVATTTLEDNVVDVSATPPKTLVLDAGVGGANDHTELAIVTITDNGGIQLGGSALGTGDYTLADDIDPVVVTVTGNFVTGALMTLEGTAGCGAAAIATGVATGTTSYTITVAGAGTLTAATPYYVCYDTSGVAAATEIPTTTPTVSVALRDDGTGLTTVNSASGTGYALELNGFSEDLVNYVPAAAAPYMSWLRVMNTGTIAADFSVTVYDETTGTVQGSTGVIAANLGAGEAVTVSATAIEAATGVTLAASDRPWIQVTAPTQSGATQVYMQDANGGYTNMTFDTSK